LIRQSVRRSHGGRLLWSSPPALSGFLSIGLAVLAICSEIYIFKHRPPTTLHTINDVLEILVFAVLAIETSKRYIQIYEKGIVVHSSFYTWDQIEGWGVPEDANEKLHLWISKQPAIFLQSRPVNTRLALSPTLESHLAQHLPTLRR
jgi:hypothetical protein